MINSDLYEEVDDSGVYKDISEDEDRLSQAISGGETIKISVIIRPSANAVAQSITSTLAYTKELTQYIIDKTEQSDIVKAQKENPDVDIFTGLAFATADDEALTMEDVRAYIASLPPEQQQQYGPVLSTMDEKDVRAMFN